MKQLLASLIAVAFVTVGTSAFAQGKKEEGKSEKSATGATKSEKASGTEKKAPPKKKKKESC